MKIEHIAIWTKDLEKMKDFYLEFFDLTVNEKYHNPVKNFSSYFLSFESGARIELMYRPDIATIIDSTDIGYAHIAISVGSQERVNAMTESFRNSGHTILGIPRTTGDGYYESVIEDIEGNVIELTV